MGHRKPRLAGTSDAASCSWADGLACPRPLHHFSSMRQATLPRVCKGTILTDFAAGCSPAVALEKILLPQAAPSMVAIGGSMYNDLHHGRRGRAECNIQGLENQPAGAGQSLDGVHDPTAMNRWRARPPNPRN